MSDVLPRLSRTLVASRPASSSAAVEFPGTNQLDVPIRCVGQIEKWQPGPICLFLATPEERRPLWSFWGSKQFHVRLLGGSAPFLQIALNARTNDVFPARRAALRTGFDVVEVQVAPAQLAATVLTGVCIAGVDVDAAEPDSGLRHLLERGEHQHPRYPNSPGDGVD